MARIGLKNALYNQIDTSTGKYKALGGGGTVPALERIISETFAPEYASAELYADDVLAETDYSFTKGTLTLTVADDDDSILAAFLGNTDASGEITKSIDDTAPEFGYGHIVTKMVKGTKYYKVEFFPRVKFTSANTDANTRGEAVEFGTTTIEGRVMPLESVMNNMAAGIWEMHETFSTLAAAQTYLTGLLTPYVSTP